MRKILSVDDEDSVLRCFKKALRAKGYEVFVTNDPTHVGRILKENDLDLVMLDVKMPKKNGLEVFQELKHKYEHLPVLFVTAYPGSFALDSEEHLDMWEKNFADGNTDILYKPIQLDMLYEKVEALIGPAATRGY